jgi:hypothetical protein
MALVQLLALAPLVPAARLLQVLVPQLVCEPLTGCGSQAVLTSLV